MTAVVTGASSGIGRATAVALARAGHAVAVGYRTDRAGAERTARLAGQGLVFPLDLADPEAAALAVDRAAEQLGGLDVLVNCAGVNRRSPALEETLLDWQRILTIDLTGPFACAQAAARRMVAQGRGGRIVNVTSVHEFLPILGGASYCAAKGGLGELTKVLALELAPYGITVNAVSPGETATPMNGVPDDQDAAGLARPAIPVGRPGRAVEVAAAIAHLAAPEAAYTTGITLTVDGGLSLMSAIANQRYAAEQYAYENGAVS
ncbi:SDR family oxidoreductase [Kitasatospora sp. MAP5-34]|uniref:SDR family oxidoreductase n=1 Tax=Kitasatospora sp. MAP5-34 TaxID=3035102 RepID=UPI002473CBF2|nr:SDR family oxidoreductase [Kitasatospora sp. MAP5-34]MDH6575359.1 NAD(P)-dependent dehydrogenase (short-subunit alcohol dehydrogenase family) [Kitasatospora sp. MAP5-34]